MSKVSIVIMFLLTSGFIFGIYKYFNSGDGLAGNDHIHSSALDPVFLTTEDDVGLENDTVIATQADLDEEANPNLEEVAKLEEKFKKIKNPTFEEKQLYREKISHLYDETGVKLTYHSLTE